MWRLGEIVGRGEREGRLPLLYVYHMLLSRGLYLTPYLSLEPSYTVALVNNKAVCERSP